ncbi:MAG: GNAT family N-acetyltransferase [Clostridia bacterium]|jgi:GNAT superfamily N-acetyltransferase|nr:GNAT family N-acetyltransferase [Clostridia bacterium]MBT7122484.1 GNAT family N-acetyltransferase [Clostridia bacterium]
MIWNKDDYVLTDDFEKMDVDKVCDMLMETYWAKRNTKDIMKKSFSKSICFSLFYNDEQIGFARVVSDEAVFSWICDVVVEEPYRGKGLGSWMMDCITNFDKISSTRQLLATRDAHGFYEKFGFNKAHSMLKVPQSNKQDS